MVSECQFDNPRYVENRPPIGKGRRANSRDMQSSMDSRLAKCELAVDEMREQVEDTERGIEELDSAREELKGEMQGALNEAMDVLTQRNEALEAHVVAMRGSLSSSGVSLLRCELPWLLDRFEAQRWMCPG